MELEDSGVAAVAVASIEFKTAAEVQGRQLGFDASFVYTAHPIQDRTDDEMKAIADKAVEAIVRALVEKS